MIDLSPKNPTLPASIQLQSGEPPITLCPSPTEARVRKLGSFTLRLSGTMTSQNNAPCFDVTAFLPVRSPDGHELSVGKLIAVERRLEVEPLAGSKKLVLNEYPLGMKYYVGRDIIIAYREMAVPMRSTSMTKIVSYLLLP